MSSRGVSTEQGRNAFCSRYCDRTLVRERRFALMCAPVRARFLISGLSAYYEIICGYTVVSAWLDENNPRRCIVGVHMIVTVAVNPQTLGLYRAQQV